MSRSSVFQRLILPGFAFKAVVIGGGYATGRELVQFFMGSGPVGGLLGLGVTALLWSAVCLLTFVFAYQTRAFDYRTFFKELLGPAWIAFELAYVCLMLLVLSVFGAAAGEIFDKTFGLPALAGTLGLGVAIVGFAAFGNRSVEALFKYVSVFLYVTYACFFILMFWAFGGDIHTHLVHSPAPFGWVRGGITYGAYNLVGAVAILAVARHFESRRDAAIAGLLCGPLAILPAVLFFLSILAFYPEIGSATLPSDMALQRLGIPVFHGFFQVMVLAALLESGTGLVHALNERLLPERDDAGRRSLVALCLVIVAMFVAARVGLVDLIARGYGASAWLFLAIYIVPLCTLGTWRILRSRAPVGTPHEA